MSNDSKSSNKTPVYLLLLFVLIVGVVSFSLFRQNQRINQENESIVSSAPASTQAQPEHHEDHDPAVPHNHDDHASEQVSERHIPPYFENPKTVALAATLKPETVDAPARDAYTVAQNKPELLAQLPCFCYCDRFGHKSLHDCYVTDHAVHCDICMKEALEADMMDRQGMSGSEIRDIIVSKYYKPQS